MKKTLLLLVMFLSIFYLNAQCPTGSVLLESQTDVDDFVATYSTTCSDIPFDLEIKGNGILEDGINDVSGLDFITSIGGDLYFNNNHDLISINGFNNLTSIGGSFKYRGSYIGLNMVDDVGPGTEEIIGFNNLVSIGGDFWINDGDTNISISTPIDYSPSIEEINGFNSLSTIGGDFKFDYVEIQTLIGFSAMTVHNGSFIFEQPSLPQDGITNIFENLETINGNVSVWSDTYFLNQYGITSLNLLNNVTTVGGDVHFGESDILSGLENLETINGNLSFYNLRGTIPSFNTLRTIGGYLKIEQSNGEFYEEDIVFPNIETITGQISTVNTGFLTLTLDSLTSLGSIASANYYPGGNAAIINLDNLLTLGEIYLENQGGFLELNMNNLVSLGGIDTGAGSIGTLRMNSLTNLPNLDDSIWYATSSIGTLEINAVDTYSGNGDFTFISRALSMNSLSTINNLTIKGIELSMENLETINGDFTMLTGGNGASFNVDNLHTIAGDFSMYNTSETINLEGFVNLHTIAGNMVLAYNPGLTSLDALNNIQQVDGFITIRFNENLQDCTALCDYVLNNSNYTISDNSNLCTVTLNTCTINEIQGVVLQSADNIDCTNGSYAPENMQVTATDGTNSYTSFTNENGEYSIILPEGNYTVSVMPPSVYIDATPTTTTINIVGTDNVEMADFCLTYNTLIDDVRVAIIPPSETRPGFTSSYSIVYTNTGTTIQDGEVSLVFDDTRVSYASSTETPLGQVANVITWSYTNLLPNEVRSFTVTFDVEPPPINNGGNTLFYTANITPTVDDINIDDNEFILREVMVNSYDPNDKRVLEGEHLLIDDVDEYLYYVIRFQNLGTASAINIRVRDIMSDLIDWDTFQPIEASHDYRVELATGEDQKLEFIFDNINLPDSTTDEEGSHGYVAFKVKPKSTVQVGDLLHNRAAIYFDFNAPIITNETETRIVEDIDSDTIYNYLDNCPNEANTDQADLDGDGMGDVCDDDSDGDGIPNVDDTCPLIADSNNNDFDEDGIGDICDDDDDNDGILDVNDDCPYYAGTTTDGCPFYLPTDNFVIETTSETCVNQNNAKINIKAASVNNYEVSVTLNGAAIVIPVNTFTQELDIENLSAGTYELCISIPAENYEQCFTLEIEDPATLNANSALSRSNEYSLDLIGAINYSIFINGEEFTINAPDENTLITFTKQLSAPVNNIEVKTEKECQGKYTEVVKTIENLEFTIVPNPTNGDIFITSIFGDEETNGTINIYDLSGRLISTQVVQFPMQNKRIKINNLTAGVYFVTLNTDNYNTTKKLIKK